MRAATKWNWPMGSFLSTEAAWREESEQKILQFCNFLTFILQFIFVFFFCGLAVTRDSNLVDPHLSRLKLTQHPFFQSVDPPCGESNGAEPADNDSFSHHYLGVDVIKFRNAAGARLLDCYVVVEL